MSRRQVVPRVFAIAILFISTAITPCMGASFEGLFHGTAFDLSADGSVIVGQVDLNAVRWTPAGGVEPLCRGIAHGVSPDGLAVVGRTYAQQVNTVAFRWTYADGLTTFGSAFSIPVSSHQEAIARAVSNGGHTVVGEAQDEGGGWHAFSWTSTGGMRSIGGTYAYDVSADGMTIAGTSLRVDEPQVSADNTFDHPGINTVPQEFYAQFRAISTDGQIAVGNSPGGVPVLWRDGDQVRILPRFSPTTPAYTRGLSSDASVVVGYSYIDDNPDGSHSGEWRRAVIWDDQHGLRLLESALRTDYGIDTGEWILHEAVDISADGKVIIGTGYDPDGEYASWVAVVPEPTVFSLLALGGLGLRRRRKA